MKDVAKAAGVSPMTVSRAFSQDSSVSKATREKIMGVAEQMGYVFDSTASNLRSQKTGFVAVIIPSLNNANFSDTVSALSGELATHNLQILLGYTGYNMEEEERLIGQLLRRRPEAIVVTGGRHTAAARRMLEKSAIPVVEIWDLPEDPIDHVVGFSNAATMGDLVDHLVALNHKKIGFIGADADGDTRGADRRRGFLEALGRHQLDVSRLISAGPAPISMREGAEAMARLLQRFPDTEAVVCVSDLTAFGALTECQRREIRVPGEIAVAGFGAYDISAYSVPTITTIDAFSFEIGREAGNLISGLLKNPEASREPQIRNISPELVVRQSTGRA
jgi:LacI family transcriptional regulator, gluconate utilization system Gnt-I transcriptional repressor